MKAAKFRARDEATFGDSDGMIRDRNTPEGGSISPASVTCNPESDRDNDVPRCGAVIPDMRNQIPLCAPRVPAIAGAILLGGNRIPHNDNAIPDNDNDLPVIAAWRAYFAPVPGSEFPVGDRRETVRKSRKMLGVPAISAACGVKFSQIPCRLPC